MATESTQRLKRGRPIGSKDKQPQKSKRGAGSESIKETVQNIDGPAEPTQTVEPLPAPRTLQERIAAAIDEDDWAPPEL